MNIRYAVRTLSVTKEVAKVALFLGTFVRVCCSVAQARRVPKGAGQLWELFRSQHRRSMWLESWRDGAQCGTTWGAEVMGSGPKSGSVRRMAVTLLLC